MAEIADNGGGGDKGKKRAKKGSTRVDMTPMVDLAFLLLTFFVLTSTFQKPKVMSLTYPAKPEKNETKQDQKINNAITFLLSKGRVFYYKDKFRAVPEDGKPATTLEETNFGPDGVRKLLRDGNKLLIKEIFDIDNKFNQGKIQDSTRVRLIKEAKKNKSLDPLNVLIKTDDKALTKEFIDIIDELYIANIAVIAPVDLMKDEQKLIDEKIK